MAFLGVLNDQTNGAQLSNGDRLTSDGLKKAADLLTVYLNRYVAAFWGMPAGGCLIRAGRDPLDVETNEIPDHTRLTIDEAPTAIAYHTVNGLAVPDIEDGFSLSNGLWIPGGWLGAQSHEWAETLVNPATDLWVADGAGKLYAREACDAIEMQSWLLELPDGTSGYVSNFLLPSFFERGAPGPYDYMTYAGIAGAVAPKGPFQTAAGNGGNYQIVETDAGDATQVHAMRARSQRVVVAIGDTSRRLAKKRHQSSRPYRIGLRLQEAA